MTRLSIGLVLAASLVSGVALAESQAEIAARLNEEGKQLMFANPPRYAEASAKFQEAHSRAPEPKYFFNHCTSLFQEGKFGEALTACNAADKNADDKLKPKIAKLIERIHEEAKKQNIDLQPVGGGGGPGDTPPNTNPSDPNAPPPPPQQQPQAVGRPPTQGVYTAVAAENTYMWTLGVDLLLGGGVIGREGYFGKVVSGLRVKGDYLLLPSARAGAQAYIQYTHFNPGDTMSTQGYTTLDILDFGFAGYKHICGPRARFCITPLLGVQLAMFSPAGEMDVASGSQVFNYASFGARGEVGFSYALGSRYEHVLTLAPALTAYTRAFTQPDGGYTAAEWGLDRGGAAITLAFGYTYRFNTPFGSAPFVTLE